MKAIIKILLATELSLIFGAALPNGMPDARGEAKDKLKEGSFIISSADGVELTSIDGITWSKTPASPPTQWQSQCCGNATCVSVSGSRLIHASTNDTNWITENGFIGLKSVAFGNGNFAAVGHEGLIVTSGSDMVWKERKSGIDERLRGVTFGNNKFVAVGYEGTILTSRSGTDWKLRTSGTARRLQSVAFGNGAFVAAGWHGTILTSRNGSHWRASQTGLTNRLERVVFRNGVEAAAVDDRTPNVPSAISVPSGHKVAFHAIALGNQIYVATPSAADSSKFEWSFLAPEATLYDMDGAVVGKHYAGPTWESNGGGKVTAARISGVNVDSPSIPLLLLKTTSIDGHGVLGRTEYVQRLNTVGGLAPAAQPTHAGEKAHALYKADYYFFRAVKE